MSNSHFETAEAWIDDSDGERYASEYGLKKGLVEATLALAFEQRTANLLAYLQPVECAGGGFAKVTVEIASEVLTEVHKRLDRPTKPPTPGAEAYL